MLSKTCPLAVGSRVVALDVADSLATHIVARAMLVVASPMMAIVVARTTLVVASPAMAIVVARATLVVASPKTLRYWKANVPLFL